MAQAFQEAEAGDEVKVNLDGPPTKELIEELERKGYSYSSIYQLSHRSGQLIVQTSQLVINPKEVVDFGQSDGLNMLNLEW